MKIEDLIFKDFFEQIIPNIEKFLMFQNRKFHLTKGINTFILSLNQTDKRADGTCLYTYSLVYDYFGVLDHEINQTCSIK